MGNSDKLPETIHDTLDIKNCSYVPKRSKGNMRFKASIKLNFDQILDTWINLISESQWSTYFYHGSLVTVAAPGPRSAVKIPLLLIIHKKEEYAHIYMIKSTFEQLPSEIKNRLHVKDPARNGSNDKTQSSNKPQKEVAETKINQIQGEPGPAIRKPKPMVWGAYRSQILSLLNDCIVSTTLSLDVDHNIDCFLCTEKDRTGHTRYYLSVETYNKLAVSVKELMNYQGEDKFLSSLQKARQFTSTHPVGKQLRDGKKLRGISKKAIDRLFLNNKVKTMDVDFNDGTDQVVIRLYQSVASKKLYILQQDFEKIPDNIRRQLNIPYRQSAHTNKKTRKSEESFRKIVSYSGKIVINDDSIISRCKSYAVPIGEEKYRLDGYISETTGSLLVPASVFIKTVPMELWHESNISDPKRLLPPQGQQGLPYGIGDADLQDCSILFKYGYSVRKSVPYDTRRKALDAALTDHAITKEQAIRHINHLIALNKTRYPNACARWRDDIEYLNQLPDSDS